MTDAWDDLLEILEAHWRPTGLGGIMHCFGAGYEQAQRSLEERRTLFEKQLRETNREEEARALTLVDAQLAVAARERGDVRDSAK